MQRLWWCALVLLLAGCPSSTNGPIEGLVRLEVAPNNLLLTQQGEIYSLNVRGFDVLNQPVQLSNVQWISSHPEQVSVGSTGVLQAQRPTGSAQILAKVGNLVSAPLLVLVAKPVEGAVLLNDNQLPLPPQFENPTDPVAVGNRFSLGVVGFNPTLGQVLIGREGKAFYGKVVALGGGGLITLEVIPLAEAFEELAINQTLDLSLVKPQTPEGVNLSQLPDGTWLMAYDDTASAAAATKGPICKLEGVARFGQVFKLELQQRLSFPVAIEIRAGRLEYLRFLVQGSLVAVGSLGVSVGEGVEFQLKCTLEMGSQSIPVGGMLSFLIQPEVPVGMGFKAKAVGMAEMLAGKVEGRVGAEVKVGFEYTPAKGLSNLSEFTPILQAQLTKTYPMQKGPRLEAGVDVFGYANLSVASLKSGWSWLDEQISSRTDLLEATFGPRVEANLSIAADQANDPNYAADYALKMRLNVETAGDLKKKVLERFERLAKVADIKLTSDINLSRSPYSPNFQATPNAVSVGETVRFYLELYETNFGLGPLGFYNVGQIELYRLKNAGFIPALLPFQVLPATAGQRVFEYLWTPTIEDLGEHFFVAFVRTVFLSQPLYEVDKNSQRKVVVSGPVTESYITLNYALSLKGANYPAGIRIPLSQIKGAALAEAHPPMCNTAHLHAQAEGIYIAQQGPFPDPDPEGCGYGAVTLIK